MEGEAMTLYNLRSALDDYRITKFDRDLNPESSYLLGPDDRGAIQCECPAGVRPSCRHRQMLPHLLPLVDTEWFWDFERSVAINAEGALYFPPEVMPLPKTALDIISDPANWETVSEVYEAELTSEDIEALPDGVEKDFHQEMQETTLSPNSILDDIPFVEVSSPAKSNGWRRI
jgi:hypothetical protein